MTETTVLKRKEGIMAADLNGETVMMDVATGKYYNIGSVGGDIWNILEKEMTVAELVQGLMKIYDVDEATCKKDIQPFIEKMVTIGLFVQN